MMSLPPFLSYKKGRYTLDVQALHQKMPRLVDLLRQNDLITAGMALLGTHKQHKDMLKSLKGVPRLFRPEAMKLALKPFMADAFLLLVAIRLSDKYPRLSFTRIEISTEADAALGDIDPITRDLFRLPEPHRIN